MNAQGSDALFPLVYLEVRDNASVDELRAMFEVIRAAGKRGTRHVTMTDSGGVKGMPDATVRRFVAEQQADVERKYGHLVIGSAVVVNSAVVRGALTAINWIKPTTVQQVYSTSTADALAQCVRWLEGERIVVPSALRDFQRAVASNPRTPPPGFR